MAAASRERLSDLHDLLAEALIEQITAARENRLVEVKTFQGEETYVKVLPAALVTAAIKFLKDNGIEAVADKNPKLKELQAKLYSLPFPTSQTGTE